MYVMEVFIIYFNVKELACSFHIFAFESRKHPAEASGKAQTFE